MVTYSWKILRVDCYQTVTAPDGQVFNDVIYAVQWQITGAQMVDVLDENGQTVSVPQNTAWVYDVMGFDSTIPPNFIQRPDVTEDILIGWVQNNLGAQKIAELEAQIAQMLADMEQQ